MFLHIEPSDHLAIYDQVVRQIKFSVASGAIRPGEFVASVRELARELAINPNTVSRAYRRAAGRRCPGERARHGTGGGPGGPGSLSTRAN